MLCTQPSTKAVVSIDTWQDKQITVASIKYKQKANPFLYAVDAVKYTYSNSSTASLCMHLTLLHETLLLYSYKIMAIITSKNDNRL